MDKRLTIEMDSDDKNAFKAKSASEGKTLKEKLTELIRDYLRNE